MRGCPSCQNRNSPIQAYCSACGKALAAPSDSPAQAVLSDLPVADAVLGDLLFCIGEEGSVEVISLSTMIVQEKFRLPLDQVVGERPLIEKGLLLVCGRNQVVVVDLWFRYQGQEVAGRDRSTVFPFEGEVMSELSRGPGKAVCLLTQNGRYSFLNRYSLAGDSPRLLEPVALPGPGGPDFAGLAPHNDSVFIAEAMGTRLWLVGSDGSWLERRLRHSFSYDALRPHPRGVVAAGARGELSLLDDPARDVGRRFLAGPYGAPLLAWSAGPELAVLCHGSWIRLVQFQDQRVSDVCLPQHCAVAPVFDRQRIYLASDEGSLYTLEVSLGQGRVVNYQPLFLSPGGTPLPPRVVEGQLVCFGGNKELVRFRDGQDVCPTALLEA